MFEHQPVIGILVGYNKGYDTFGLSEAFIKWLQVAKCHVVYVPANVSYKEIKNIFHQTDCFVIPGGDTLPIKDNESFRKASYLLKLAQEHGSYPVIGVCMGFQFMISHVSKSHWFDLRTFVESLKEVKPLHTIHSSRAGFLKVDVDVIHNHHEGILYKDFLGDKRLVSTFHVTTLSKSMNTKFYEYVSTIEGKQLPWFGFQWHPEKHEFELSTKLKIPRSKRHNRIGRDIVRKVKVLASKIAHRTTPEFMTKYSVDTLTTLVGATESFPATFRSLNKEKRNPHDAYFS